MNELRLILLIVGVLFLAGLAGYEWWRARRSRVLAVPAREGTPGADAAPSTGRAPLPVFAHLGFEFSAFTFPPTVLNRRKDGTWDVISLAAPDRGSGAPFFAPAMGFPDSPSEATGRVAPVFVLPEAGHHPMLDQPLILLTALRALLADWDHSEPHRRR